MYVEGIVTGPTGLSRTVTFVVDSGAKYSLLPLEILGLILHPFNRTLQPSRLLLA